MRVWLVKLEEPLPVDVGYRPYRMGMLADRLLEGGHSVVRWASDYDHLHHVYRTGRTGLVQLDDRHGLFLLHKKTAYEKAVSGKRILNNFQLARMFEKLGRNMERPDIIVCAMPTPEMAAASARLANRFQIPLVLDARDMWPDIIGQALETRMQRLLSWPVLALMRRNLRYAARNASALIGITAFFRDYLLRYAGRSGRWQDAVFHIGYDGASEVNTEPQQDSFNALWDHHGIGDGPGQFNIYFAGRLNKTVYNALDPVLQAAELLLNEMPGLRIVLCGTGDYAERIRDRTARLPNIVLPGEVSSGCLKVLQARAHAALLCVERRIDYQMSLSNKFFEYLQAGMPVLSGLDGVPGETIADGGCGFVYNDGQELADRIRVLNDRPELRASMSVNARRLFEEKFNATRIYSEFSRHLERVAAQTSDRKC